MLEKLTEKEKIEILKGLIETTDVISSKLKSSILVELNDVGNTVDEQAKADIERLGGF
ncbi:MAG: hypothetical protein Q8P34_08320 [Bacteroidota bacterium]|nr:hypothetical protein [Bacteroidota bacterium]